jgi:hypothetical protein
MSYPMDQGDESFKVELLGVQGDPSSGYRQALFDPATQAYFFPTTPEMRVDPSLLLAAPQRMPSPSPSPFSIVVG